MKIIKEGNPNKKHIRFECSVCGCVFENNKDECSKMGVYSDSDIYLYRCPCCGEDVFASYYKGE